GRKAELRDHVHAQLLLFRELNLALKRLVERVQGNARMAFGIAADADLADAALGEHPLLEHLETVVEWAFRPRLVAADEKHAVHAVFRGGPLQELPELLAIADAPRRDVRHRIEPRSADCRDHVE